MSVNANLIECLIQREGPTIFHIGKVQYIFAPRPEITGDMEASVCVVVSQEHRDYLTKDRMCSQYYRVYQPKVPIAADLLEQEEFREWQRLRKTMTPEEILAMTVRQTTGEPETGGEQEPAPAAPKGPGRPKGAASPAAQPAASATTPLAGNTAKPDPPQTGPGLDEMF